MARVTEIIKAAGLMNDRHYTDYARERGSMVHLALQYHDQNRLDGGSLDPAVQPYLVQYMQFLRQRQPTIIRIEDEVRDDALGVVGHFDRLYAIGDEEWLVDFKTGGEEGWHGVQTAAYLTLADLTCRRAALYLSPEGWHFQEHNQRRDFARWNACITLYNTRHEWGLL